MVLDHKKIAVPRIKTALQAAITPIEYVIILPERAFNFTKDYLTLQHELIHDKYHWQDQRLIMQAQLQQLNALKIQNQQLQALLKTTPVQQDQHYIVAKVISLNGDSFNHEYLLSHGSTDGVYDGQAVIAADGVIGQVIQVNPVNSRVMLLTDARSAVPVINQRTQENFIVIGTGDNSWLQLMNAPSGADLKPGDTLLSSGLGGHYPEGYPVGVIVKISNSETNAIRKVWVKPAAALDKAQLVILPLNYSQGKKG